MCTNSVNITGSNNIVTLCQLILQFSAGITMKVIGDGLVSRQVTSLGHRMDVYQVQLLLAVSVEGMCNPSVTEWTYTRFRACIIDVVCKLNVIRYIVSV